MQQAPDQMEVEYAQEHKKFLKENNPSVLEGLRQSGDLNSYLSSVGEQASEMFMTLMMQYKRQLESQNLPHLELVQALQSRRHEANEIVLHDIVYQPLRED